jgi:hypothetical protein
LFADIEINCKAEQKTERQTKRWAAHIIDFVIGSLHSEAPQIGPFPITNINQDSQKKLLMPIIAWHA